MNVRSATIIMVLLVLGTVAGSLMLYPHLPAHLPVHWNWHGQPNGWKDKSFVAYLMPNIIAACLILMHVLPYVSPKPFSIEPFAKTYYYVCVLVAGLMTHIHVLTLLIGLSPNTDYSRPFLTGLFVFMGLLGNVLGKVRRNRWIGVRTPWTLASDEVWIPTHRLAARLLFVAGIVATIAIWAGISPKVCLVLFGIAFLIPILESYRLYNQLENH